MNSTTLALIGSALIASPAAAQDHSQHAQPQETPANDPHAGHVMPAPTPEEQSCTLTIEGAGEMACSADMGAKPMQDQAHQHGVARPADHHDGHAGHAAMPGVLAFSEGSGTARLPGNEGMMQGLHFTSGAWMLMAHGFVQASYTDHGGPRGDEQFYVTNMGMLSAETKPDWGRVQLKTMLSLEPLMEPKGYPNLFATGETAYGVPLVDRQHPHDLFMELSARIDANLGDGGTTMFLYGGPVGEPALGPSAFMHRGSAALNPEPPITHHWFDSTHITYGVLTGGFSSDLFQLEASTFRGREPDEERWNIETPRLDSWSLRGTVTPNPALAFQASYGDIKSPEAAHADEDERRFTASAHFTGTNGLSAMLAFSSKKHVEAGHEEEGEEHHEAEPALTAWLAEANWDFTANDTVFARFENVANDELFPDEDHPLHEQRFRVSKMQLGYARGFDLGPTRLAVGASGALYAKPAVLDPYYGKNPFGFTVFAKVSLGD